MKITRDYRSLPLWLARDYLIEIGGAPTEGYVVQGATWVATVRDGEDVQIGRFRIGQIFVDFEADENVLPGVLAAFEKKAMRAGG